MELVLAAGSAAQLNPPTASVVFLAIVAIALLAWGAHRNVPKSKLEGALGGAAARERTSNRLSRVALVAGILFAVLYVLLNLAVLRT
jgi:hypothetical protein